MKEAQDIGTLIELFKIWGCTVGMQKCEESTSWFLRYLCKAAAAAIGC